MDFHIDSTCVVPLPANGEEIVSDKKLVNGEHSQIGLLALGSIACSSSPRPLLVKKLSQNAILPSRCSALAAGYDLASAHNYLVPARGKALIQTDLSIAVPAGTYGRIAPRSGLAWKHSIDVGAGVIDADYCGPLGVILFNHSDQNFAVKVGDRVAQLILEKIDTPAVIQVESLEATIRSQGGFGSTGVATIFQSA